MEHAKLLTVINSCFIYAKLYLVYIYSRMQGAVYSRTMDKLCNIVQNQGCITILKETCNHTL
jgi:hypothetical protein